MHRTNIYLTLEQEAGLAALASARGVSRSDVIREVLDRELGLDGGDDPLLDEAIAEVAGAVAVRARTLSLDDPDLTSA